MSDMGHGVVGRRVQDFTSLLPLRAVSYDPQALARLAADMKGEVDTVKDGPDPEENILVPAGYTYFGQFVDHDLTFDSTSTLDPASGSTPTNLRTPRFDLDCLYGDGPDAQPFMYDPAGEKLLFKDDSPDTSSGATAAAARDLLRNPNGRAIIGDKRNDENSIVSQLQLAFIKYHNAVVDELKKRSPSTWSVPHRLFPSARNEVRWTYQRLLIDDFLPRIVHAEVLGDLQHRTPTARALNYALYTPNKRDNLPREFVAAAYRFGHSGVRTGYRMNAGLKNRFSIFPASNDPTPTAGADSLLGFDPITNNQVIDDWGRFFPSTLPMVPPVEPRNAAAGTEPDGALRLQFAYKLDPTLVDPLGVLPRSQVAGDGTAEQASEMIKPAVLPDTEVTPPRPSLALLNLLRGDSYRIASGQAVAAALLAAGLPCKVLHKEQLVVRKPGAKDGTFRFQRIASVFDDATPLWFYILAEAQAPIAALHGHKEFSEDELLTGVGAKSQLGWVGGRIVAEVFYGLLDADEESFFNAAPAGWTPMLPADAPLVVRSLLHFADPSNA
ncbi:MULTISPECIES: peroxidase family protein [unclassified Variovorax]|uniref:peroxidase family protein n=1 Tax=unclassified Variovorax TaxID=663243 RepID=UPI003F470D60